MKKVFELAKGETVKDVYLNGLKQYEGGDYSIKNGNVKFNKFVGGDVNFEDIVTIVKEKTELVKK